ncbi:MAG: hypothetical protein AAGU16_00920 [Desulfitobacterium hafniense]
MVNNENMKKINNLRDTFMSFFESEILSVDIADIYQSSSEIVEVIENLIEFKDSKEDFIDALVSITTHIDHMKWHNESIKKIIGIPE